MQQNHHNHAKLLHEFQFHTQPKIRRKQVSHKSATKIFGRPNNCRKIPLAGRMTVKYRLGSTVSVKSQSFIPMPKFHYYFLVCDRFCYLIADLVGVAVWNLVICSNTVTDSQSHSQWVEHCSILRAFKAWPRACVRRNSPRQYGNFICQETQTLIGVIFCEVSYLWRSYWFFDSEHIDRHELTSSDYISRLTDRASESFTSPYGRLIYQWMGVMQPIRSC